MRRELTSLHSEAELVEDLINNKPAGYEILYEKYSSALNGLLIEIVGKEHSADLLKQTFLQIFKTIHEYDQNQCRLFTWMIRIARESGLKQLNISKLSCNIDYNIISSKWGNNGFYLAYFKGYTEIDVSKELKIPIGQVRQEMRISRKKFQQDLGINDVQIEASL